MHTLSLAALSKALHNGEFSSVELTQYYLDRIDQYNGTLNAYITPCHETALAQAKAADIKLSQQQAGPLTGIPIAHKDIFCTQGLRTSCASKMLANFISPYNATVVDKIHTAGMVMLGKTNMDEFAMGSSNETSFFGPVGNPWDLQRVPGGSSGGSAAAVAAGLAPIATGTDTGGSIRQPASLCNLTGVKPTYGRVSRYGMIAFASSLDQAGPMAHSAEDAALLLTEMAGFDPRDSTSVDTPVPNYIDKINAPIQGLKIGIPDEYMNDTLSPAVNDVIQDVIAMYQSLGASIHPISLPHTHLAVPTYYVVAPAECSSNLSRMDGVRFGHRCDAPTDLLDLYQRSRGEGFGNEVKRRIMAGTYALSEGYYDAYYLKAQKTRRLISQDFRNAFEQVDIILSPTTPTTAFAQGEKSNDPIAMYLADIFTISTNLAGLPALSIPAGFIDELPIGLQLIGNYFDEAKLFNVAHQYQQVTDWHQRQPALFQ